MTRDDIIAATARDIRRRATIIQLRLLAQQTAEAWLRGEEPLERPQDISLIHMPVRRDE